MGPCAKQRVMAVVVYKSPLHHGVEYVVIGENVCLTPQSTCPRTPGEGYAKCHTHCAQLGHAEEVAIRQILRHGIAVSDVLRIEVFGHSGPCDNCRSLLTAYGLLDVTKFYPLIAPCALTDDVRADIDAAYNLSDPSSHSRHAAKQCAYIDSTQGQHA